MKYVVLAIRSILGLAFLAFGLMYFLRPMEQPPLTPAAGHFMQAIYPTGYLTVVKILEVTGGFLLLTRLFVPLGLVLLTPVIVNITLFDALLMKAPGLGIPLLAMAVFLIWAYRAYFAPLFTLNAHAASWSKGGACGRCEEASVHGETLAKV